MFLFFLLYFFSQTTAYQGTQLHFISYNQLQSVPNQEIEMSSEGDYDSMSQHTTSRTREQHSYLYPTSGASPHEVYFLDKYRENVSIPPGNYSRHMEEKRAATADNDQAARAREAAGSVGRDWAYTSSDWRHTDSKRHYDPTL
ncbi:uncharacterized protein A1O5_02796 [Cladophialophora psammophila CBS 110553]|uniref:Uncharacterized protein n=1 Tax=Cladophialophora psammophila CBS 110553 TaxID=1182543 RepID=W9XAZ8_9EURO|nr:uncharacterized protein A1O5_02796 [Cladophialophora psammophila CBS 110553]EXJ74500.1 hypothetical protein A1O5_02796 [Cladophialophora psammophila CBS 110553]